jgi:signal transduction histidine kinase
MTSFVHRFFGHRGTLQRKYALATGLFAGLVLAIILVFGHFIAQSLSRRYLEDLFETGREEAQRMAEELGRLEPEALEVFQRRHERLSRTPEGRPQRMVIDRIVVKDIQGKVVYESDFRVTEELPDELIADLELDGELSDEKVTDTQDSYQIEAPIGDVGSVMLSINRARIRERVALLRSELLSQIVTVAILTLTIVVMAFVIVWFLIQRTRRLEAKTREAEDFAALGTLAANLAHEIRNPLNSINLNLELLEEDFEAYDTDVTGSLATTRREVGRLARLVSDFLSYAKPSEPVPEEVSVAAMLSDVREFLAAEAKSCGVHLRLEPELPADTVLSDEGQLRQILLNLVLNAVQAVSGLEPERRMVELAASIEDRTIALIVRDRGDGIPEDELKRVRKAFYTRRRGGTGLGLAIAERFAESQGGRVELANLDPIGFEARVVLPITDEDVNMSERRSARADR